jgi:asparagine synthase (glutamine-hydrolysing)
MKAILATGLLEPELDREELAHYLQYLYVRPDRTIYRNVHCLPPGHKIVVRDGKARVERYWDLPAPSPLVSQPEAVVEFRRLLESAIQKQLIADVPVAAFLSGGLDSTTITAFASRRHPGLRTISFGFEGQLSELPFARDAAKRFGTDHVEIEENRVDVGDLLLEMARVYDEPFADSSNIPTYLISKAAREFAKVVLTGDGGDELLAGYSYWYGPIADMRLAEGTSAAVRTLLRVSSALCRRLHLPFPARLMRLERGARYRKQHGSAERAHRAQQQFFSDQELRALGLKPVIDGLWPEIEASDDVDWAMRADLRRYLPGDILVKTDRASMAHGLELRAPFLDVDLATFCISLPSCLKLNQGVDKYLLREACGGEWPDSIGRRSKQGFGAPVGQWLARPDVSELMHEYLERRDRVIYTLLPYDECRGLRRSRDYRAWSLLVLSIWLETHRCSMPLADQALR